MKAPLKPTGFDGSKQQHDFFNFIEAWIKIAGPLEPEYVYEKLEEYYQDFELNTEAWRNEN